MDKLLTILIPTKNRHLLLDRSLLYYVKSSIHVRIIIADSSDNALRNNTKKVFDKYSNSLNIDYFHAPENIEASTKNNIAIDMVRTPYVLNVGDDDFPLKSSIETILSKLEKDSSISAAFGDRIAITQVSNKETNQKWIKVYPNYSGISITNDNTLDRIRRLPIPNWQQYPNAIIRTKVFKKAFEVVSKFEHTQYAEFFTFSMILACGKWIKYDILFAVCHQESKFCHFKDRYLFPSYIGAGGSVMNGISQDKWSKVVSFLCYKIADEILIDTPANIDNVALEIRKIYYSKLVHYLEHNNKLSDYLIDKNSIILRKINNVFRKFCKLYWMLVLYNKSGGIYEFVRFLLGFVRELLNGRFLRMLFNSKTDLDLVSLLNSIKRTGSLDYESDNLLRSSSKYYKEYKIIFDIWENNPCPQRLKDELHDK